jgi:2-polyprenyl-6-methoxyphenol hydroxylase-like FAD-dependent oxidoreductase
MKPRIAIIGGGPGGLTLARILHQHGIRATVFEREVDPFQRSQGGTLDLHEDSGLLALKEAGLMGEFFKIARYEDQGSKLFDKAGNLLFEDGDSADGSRPEVDRTALRSMLLKSLPQECVRWNHTLQEITVHPDGGWSLQFDDGKQEKFDLIVGADGARSRVRPLLSPYAPQYSGISFLEFGIDDVDNKHPSLSKLVGAGKIGVEADGKGIIVQRNAHAHLRGYAIFRVPLGWIQNRFDFASPKKVREALVSEYGGYADQLLDLFRASNDNFSVRPIYALPVGHCWQNQEGLTLIGDAAHVMSPFGGAGVNNAMLDATDLAKKLAENVSWKDAVWEYEKYMFNRIIPSAAEAAEAVATLLSHDGQALTLKMYHSHQIASTQSLE